MMNKSSIALIALGLATAAPVALAQDAAASTESRPYLTGMYSYTDASDRRDSDVGHGGYFGVGAAVNDYIGVEYGAFLSQFDSDGASKPNEFKEYGLNLDGLFFYSRNASFSPYFAIGGGYLKNREETTNLSSVDPFVHAGLGFMKYFKLGGGDVGIRADARYRRILFDDDAFGQTGVDDVGEAVIKLGLVIPVGGRSVETVKAEACPDSDGDGVCDSADLCPGTPKGVKVDAKGCPPVDKPPVADQGPNRKFEDVYFAFDKSDLTDYSRATLDSAASTINSLTEKYPGLKVDVSGHTDWVGTDGYNQGLSESRANVVRDYLTRKGISADRISTYAFGESRPVAPNETDEGRALNRRTEIRTSSP